MNKATITFTPEFKREYKRLAKRYASLESDMRKLIGELKENPSLGQPLGSNAYKIRLAISSKNKGKSGGARVITYFMADDLSDEIYLLSIYDKSEQSSISNKAITSLINRVMEEN